MITVPEGTKKIVERSRYLSEAISKRLINYSALARYIRPELEEMLLKNVSDASIIMALKRLESEFQPKYKPQRVFKKIPEINMRSSLHFFSVQNREATGLSLLLLREADSKSFQLKNTGINDTSFILSDDLFEKYRSTIEAKSNYLHDESISALTIFLPEEALKNSGIYYFFLKSLAWEGINILEIVSVKNELTLILSDKDIQIAYTIIRSLFKKEDAK